MPPASVLHRGRAAGAAAWSSHSSRVHSSTLVERANPGAAKGAINAATGQLWALRSRIRPGDSLVMPLKSSRQLALGRVTTGYQYRAENPAAMRHVVGVDWQVTDLPRTAAKQDLRHTLSSSLTAFAPTRNNSIARLEALLADGVDPGAVEPLSMVGRTEVSSGQSRACGPDDAEAGRAAEGEGDSDVDAPELAIDFEQVIAEGFVCDVAPPGPDGGVDITAGRGPLGIDSPTVIVQVKSGDGVVGDPVVSQLQGTVARHGADQGLLVAWGRLTRPAQAQVREHRLKMAVWVADDVVQRVLANYHWLPADIRARLPLKQVWMLADVGE